MIQFMTTPIAETTDPFVAVVVPCRNEATFIRGVIDSLLASSYPRDRLEALFVDGMSTDGTRAILDDAAREHAFIRILDNPLLTTPVAMNLGVRASRAEIIVRMDAHAEYAADYIPRCVRLLQSRPNVGSAGGRSVAVPNGEGPWARAVAFVTMHRFGVGNAAYKTSSRPGEVDTVALGTFSRAVLDEVGLYDVRLTRATRNNESPTRAFQKARPCDRLRSEHASNVLPEPGAGLKGPSSARRSSPACGTSIRCPCIRTRGSGGAS